ncbi:hypothetical protein NLI96_g5244 [Meripilus lineatus]|uniref:IMD domain-containing protein n=1 Tax=Meripilus lineatus TaxID=2056292 RepID=A0AAD5V3W3_9APHY|nr:hypothetical protein NLI96_g5244 [Physisporinus lineatus]
MSRATAAFADAMAACSILKGPNYEAGTRLQAASGLHHLMGNHWHLMSETLDKQFEKPCRQHLENYRTVVHERSNTYEKALHEKSQVIRQTEMGNLKRKGRNLQSFREALAILQRQVDELDELKGQHYQEILEHEEEVWDVVQTKMCLVVRSTLDVFDRFTSKASDPVIEPMLQAVPDPFDAYGPPPAEDKIFSILPPLAVMANVPSSSPSPITSTATELETSSDGIVSGQNSWTPTTGGFFESSAAWADVPASSSTTPPRSMSPPIRTAPSPSVSPTSKLARRNSHPPGSITTQSHISRKSESKLRSVLAAIDESTQSSSSATPIPKLTNGDFGQSSSSSSMPTVQRSVSETETSSTYGPTPINGTLMTGHTDSNAWGVLNFSSFGDPPDVPHDDDITPQNTIRRPPSPFSSPPFDTTPHSEATRASPQSDEKTETVDSPS